MAIDPTSADRLWIHRTDSTRATGRWAYLSGVFVLWIAHYLGIAGRQYVLGEPVWTFGRYLAPFSFSTLEESSIIVLEWLMVWTVPFLGIGVWWSARRARAVGVTPWVSLLFLIPGVSYLLVLGLSLSQETPRQEPTAGESARGMLGWSGFLGAVGGGALAGGGTFAAAFAALDSPYGFGLFIVSPFVAGLVSALLLGRCRPASSGEIHGTAQLALLTGKLSMLVFGIEGMLCLAMAYPLTAFLAALGALFGASLAGSQRFGPAQVLGIVMLAPWMVALDRQAPGPPLREIRTDIEVDAPVERVWERVIAFPDLPPPSEAAFRLGIAYPMRARIVGQGVGAIRYCEFSTGAFVEPITRWEEPYRLSFDVVAQPPTMQEWSPYDIHPPHLTTSLRSERGEFRLTPLPGGRTRLEGSTWYRQDLAPHFYWSLWSDALIHGIHRRVLRHIAGLAEGDKNTGAGGT